MMILKITGYQEEEPIKEATGFSFGFVAFVPSVTHVFGEVWQMMEIIVNVWHFHLKGIYTDG